LILLHQHFTSLFDLSVIDMPKDKKLDREPVAHKSKRKLTFFSLPGGE
jgi:hypothetical protein